ncbi:hypothetical protein GCM10009680_84940 [Streptomyces yatensis]|uniref:Uncharacterized protein n=1 Tax=Streptomyces yatensis TaxID=155177 RepID=A0ABN2JNE8_9ACTN
MVVGSGEEAVAPPCVCASSGDEHSDQVTADKRQVLFAEDVPGVGATEPVEPGAGTGGRVPLVPQSPLLEPARPLNGPSPPGRRPGCLGWFVRLIAADRG